MLDLKFFYTLSFQKCSVAIYLSLLVSKFLMHMFKFCLLLWNNITVNTRHKHTRFCCMENIVPGVFCTPDLLGSDLSYSTWLQEMHFFLFLLPPSTTPLVASALTWLKYYFHSLWYARRKRITFRTYYHYSKGVPHFLITCTCSGTHSTLCFSPNTNNVWNTVSGLTVMAC